MAHKILRKIFLIIVLSLLATEAPFAQQKKKEKYEISQMPKAHFLIAPEAKDALLEFSEDKCAELKTEANSAYGYLELLLLAGERRSGSQSMRCAVRLVRELLQSFGYEVFEQNYRFPYYRVENSLFEVREKKSGKSYPAFPLMYSPETSFELSGKVKRPREIEKGDLVLVESKFLSRKSLGEQAKQWKEKGAIGLIIDPKMFPFNPEGLPFPRSIHSTSWHYGALPGVIVQDARELLGKEVVLRNNCRIYAGRGTNVIAKSPGDFKDYILVSAHLDSWYLGALDDGSGVVVMIRIAELLREEKPGTTGFIFSAFDGEELGLLGSRYFYEKFGASKIKAVLNLDMVSVKNNYLYATPEKAKIMPKVISASPELKDLARQTFSGIKSVKLYTGLDWWRSIYGGLPTDYEWFYSAGVPGVFIYTPDKYYHTPLDYLTWQDEKDLEEVSQAGAELVRKMAEMELPVSRDLLKMEFDFFQQDDGAIAFALQLKKGEKKVKPEKPVVYCYYEYGLEKKVELKPGQGGWYRGSLVPVYKGEYQLVAVANYQGEVRKLVKSIIIDNPVKEEKTEIKEAK